MKLERKHYAAGALTGALLLSAAAFTIPREGIITHNYYDTQHVPTYCIGETENVVFGKTYTKQDCIDLFMKTLPRYWDEIAPSIKVDITQNEVIAFADFAYNAGSAGFRRSTILKLLNQGKHEAACEAIMLWLKNPELKSRRVAERAKCLEGL